MKISTVTASLCAFYICAAPPAEAAGGFAGWRFGMTADQVKKVKRCKPYKAVRSTGGLECPNLRHLGGKVNVSFVFGPRGLRKIQLWLYRGKDERKAVAALQRMLRSWKKRYGALESPTLKRPDRLSRAQLAAAVKALRQRAAPTAKLQLKPSKSPKKHFVFASLIYNQRHGFFLFSYRQPPRP